MNIAEFLGIFADSQRVHQKLLIKGPRLQSGHYCPQTGPGTFNFRVRKNGVLVGKLFMSVMFTIFMAASSMLSVTFVKFDMLSVSFIKAYAMAVVLSV